MRTWVGFYVQQYGTKITVKVQDYLDSKILTMDEWLLAIKEGRRGDIMCLHILSLMLYSWAWS